MTDKKASGRDEQNRLIAEWLNLKHEDGSWYEPGRVVRFGKPPDFFTSEEANALVLEKMPKPELSKRNDGWGCIADSIRYKHQDRKTAICLAALALIEQR